jgi:ANTAR domain
MRHSDTLNEQLQTELTSRVIIEQAKGKLAERLKVDMDQEFTLLRDRARTSNRRLSDLTQAFIDGTETLTGPAASRPRQRLPGAGQGRHQPRSGPAAQAVDPRLLLASGRRRRRRADMRDRRRCRPPYPPAPRVHRAGVDPRAGELYTSTWPPGGRGGVDVRASGNARIRMFCSPGLPICTPVTARCCARGGCSDELICRADEPAAVLETARCSRREHYAVAVRPARSALTCPRRAAAVVS